MKIRDWWRSPLLVLALLCLLPGVPSLAAQDKKPAAETPAETETSPEETGPVAVPVAEINPRAEEVRNRLAEIDASLQPVESVTKIEEGIPGAGRELNQALAKPEFEDLDSMGSRQLQVLQQEWTGYLSIARDWKDTLNSRIQELESIRSELDGLQEVWTLSVAGATDQQAPELVIEHANTALAHVVRTRATLKERSDQLLTAQSQVVELQTRVREFLARVESARGVLRQRLIHVNEPPLWEAFRVGTAIHELRKGMGQAYRNSLASLRTFRELQSARLSIQVLVFFALVAFLFALRATSRKWPEEDRERAQKEWAAFLTRPLSSALVLTLLLSPVLYPGYPGVVRDIFILLAIIPMMRLLYAYAGETSRQFIFSLAALMVVDHGMALFFPEAGLVPRLLLLGEAVLALALLYWLHRNREVVEAASVTAGRRFVLFLGVVAFLLLSGSAVANIVGAVRLADLLIRSCVDAAGLSVAIYVAMKVLEGMVTLLLRRKPTIYSLVVQKHGDSLEKTIRNLIRITASIFWLLMILRLFTLRDPLYRLLDSFLDTKIALGTFSITPGNILAFALTLLATFIVTKLVSLILKDELLPRLRLPRGVPGAITMLTKYTLVGFGIMLALAGAGFELTKLGLVAGALGVGIGFGLQNIVFNFVSGLILAFERPIQVGDTIQMDTLWGDVKEIGIRSSCVRTFDGSEVIVPNGDLISTKVVNWTLSDRYRRLDLYVSTAYGSDPHKVREILLDVVAKNEIAMDDPAPMALFLGFGEATLNFRLLYWVPFENGFTAGSEVALGVHDALLEAGIELPLPHRKVLMKKPDEEL